MKKFSFCIEKFRSPILPYGLRKTKICYICNASLSGFLPYRNGRMGMPALLRILDVQGSDVENFLCPICCCTDRERHLCMYFDALKIWSHISHSNVLHFGPYEFGISDRIEKENPAHYVRADLYPPSPEIEKIDIMDIAYEDNYFDFILCCHVLEHVTDDIIALSELHRVLKPDGYAVLQTPFARNLKRTWEDPGIISEALKLQCYGQEDHLRLYGLDLFLRIEESGFDLHRKSHRDLLSDFDPAYYGVNPEEDLILVRKSVKHK